ncbi:hypothetical protein U5A82_11750 [Sphingobium sp. CR2-8]|uniref:hypothetical protein n=1 Tax=Sphingobium sp. CR2-8 TaxID=1306534 RepID=UPI002DBE69E4|nr:hypothetical protein [Sphingobium sp. CR2-8]MEC3911117.1 hypothetical protein [Sphingobium sp. CR2-8]
MTFDRLKLAHPIIQALAETGLRAPDYPVAYDAGKALNQAAKLAGDGGYGAQWAGQGAPLVRSLPVADLMAALVAEMQAGRDQPGK